MQHSTYQDTTFHTTPYSTFCISIAPSLKRQHFTLHHISHRIIIHIKPLHISAHHSTSRPHSTSHHAMHITTFKYVLHITLSHTTHSKPHHTSHCISTIILHHTAMSNMASNHSTSLGIPQPHFTSCITAHHHIPHVPHHHSTSRHHISHLIWHCMTSHVASHHIAHIPHCTLFHITATLGWIRHNIPHLALQNVPYHTSCDVWSQWWYWICEMWWDMVCCARNVVWCEVLLSCSGEMWNWCITHCHCISRLVTSLRPPHFTLHHSTSNAIVALFQTTAFHVTPFLTISYLSYRTSTSRSALVHFALPISNRTMSATLCITPLTSRIAPHFTLLTCHIMGHILCTPRHIQITPYCIQITPYCHIIYHYHISHYTTLHSISHAPLLASFHHICLWSHTIPHRTTMIVSHNIPCHTSVLHHFLHPTTYHISYNTPFTTTYLAVSQYTHYLIPHRTFHIPWHSTHTNP